MRMSNVVMLLIAFLCAATAALLSRAWLVGQSARAPAEVQRIASRAIVVAARDLKYGEKLTTDAVKLVQWSGDTMPKGAFLTKDQVIGPAGGRIVLSSVSENEPILEQKLLGAESNSALSAKLTQSMKAVTIRVNDVAGVAGFVQPDDRVDVFLTYGGQGAGETTVAAKSAVVVLLQNLRVLATDQVTQRNDQPTPAKAVTLEVTVEEAQKLILAGRVGELSLALNRIADTGDPQATGTIAFDDLMEAERGAKGKAKPGGPVVGVTRSVERKEYQVLPDERRNERRYEILSHQ
ncbi:MULTISPECIES: Flp pilus assembly protein CpaB [Rhodomicrobium]|uniref:Flp pilus assembly protein CpaB n=1 Tax=Rhodomicrobium TaxID=1068 RepID=UPI000B4B3380|nr:MULTISPECIES: Flp pilus assembly protein CpaB [Rhodomicrobium]